MDMSETQKKSISKDQVMQEQIDKICSDQKEMKTNIY